MPIGDLRVCAKSPCPLTRQRSSRAAFFLFASAGCLDPTQATLQVSTNVDCGDALKIGCPARVSPAMDRPVNVRTEPRASGAIVSTVSAGDVVTILNGPRAAEGFIWWQVQLADGSQGWMVQRIGFNDVLTAGES